MSRWTALAAVSGLPAVLLLLVTAAAGESAAVPGLGPHTGHPAWDLGLGWSSTTVTILLDVAYALGGTAVAAGLMAVRKGLRLDPRWVLVAAGLAVVALTAVPAAGSADHLSYLAYGRIAAGGGDPYTQDPLAWHGGTDPVAGAVQPPWQHTPSVYGPVATSLQAAVAQLGGGDLRLTAWFWQVLGGIAFLVAGLVLHRLTRHDPAANARAAVLWTLNPLLLGQLVLGGHLDVIAVAAALGALALAPRRPFVAGLALGGAVGCKVTFGLFGLAIVWGVGRLGRRAWPVLGLGALGALVILVPAQLFAGPHAYDQLHQATRMISLATPWRIVADWLDPVFGRPQVRTVVRPVALACGALLGLLLFRRVRGQRAVPRDDVTAESARAAVLLATAWVLTTPYVLPWYDAMVWGPLALLGPGLLDAVATARLTLLSWAYVPGRTVGLSERAEDLTLGFRREVAPWINLALLVAVIAWSFARRRPRRPDPLRPSVPERAR